MRSKIFASCLFTVALGAFQDAFSLAAIKRSGSSSGNTSRVNVESDWYIPVSIGTPPQKYMFLGDTGAPGFATASTLLPRDKQPHHAPIYNPNASSTAHQRGGYTYSLSYAQNVRSSGVVFQDVVTIGNLTLPDMDIETQTSNNHNQTGNTSPRSGNLGLNFDKGGQTTRPERLPTWLQRIMPSLNDPLFTVNFNTTTRTGTFDFGFIDTSRTSSPIGYAPIINGSTEWHIALSGQQLVNGTFIPSDNFTVVVDTGSGGGGIPRKVADDYFSQIEGAVYDGDRGNFVYPCEANLPGFTFGIGEWRGRIPGEELERDAAVCGDGGGKNCTSKMEVYPDDGKAVLWGMLFIEQFLVVFDWGGERVGFAEKNANGTTSASPTSSITTSGMGSMGSSRPSSTAMASEGAETRTSSAMAWACIAGLVLSLNV